MERGTGDLEILDGRATDERLEQVLRITTPADLLEVAHVVDLLGSRDAVKGRSAGRGPNAYGVGAVDRLDVVERAVEHLAALEDHEDPVAEPLGHRHVVR